MFRQKIKKHSTYDLIEDIKLITQEIINRTDNDDEKVLLIKIKILSDKMLSKVIA